MKKIETGKLTIRIALILAVFLSVSAITWTHRDLFHLIDARLIDWMMLQRAEPGDADMSEPSPLVFIDANFYYQRPEHSRIIDTLAKLGVSSQLVDFVFHETVGDAADRPLIQAVKSAGNVYFGMQFDLLTSSESSRKGITAGDKYDDMRPHQLLSASGDTGDSLYVGLRPQIPFPELAAASRGIGFLNLQPDKDGVLRRTPLLLQHQDAIYPSLAFRAVCDHLGVSADDIFIVPGKHILLKNARVASGNESRQDIVIPIDRYGNLRIKFTAAKDRIPHISYSEIHQAAEDADLALQLKKTVRHKVVLLTENVASDLKVPPGILEGQMSTGMVHAQIIQNILSENFLRDAPAWAALFIDLVLLTVVLLGSLYLTPFGFIGSTLVACLVYFGAGSLLFFKFDIIFPFIRTLTLVGAAMLVIIVVMIVERTILFAQTMKAKQLAEREFEIGRQIQSGFFPASLPEENGWEIATHFVAARHVAGDFYDAFRIGKGKHIGLVIADVCDKGLGAALYMALFRSLIRILSGAADIRNDEGLPTIQRNPRKILSYTMRTLNDYISVTHEKDGMFATVFFGILNPATGDLHFVNGGHEPPVVVGPQGSKAFLEPTGPAVGAFPYLDFAVGKTTLAPGDILLSYTDGIVDARNQMGESFGKDRLMALMDDAPKSPKGVIAEITTQIDTFTLGQQQFDDITLIAIGRNQGHAQAVG